MVEARELHAPAAGKRPDQRVAGGLEEGQPLAPAQEEDVGGDGPECVDGAGTGLNRNSCQLVVQNPMASRSSRTVPRPGWGSALRMSRRLMALGCP